MAPAFTLGNKSSYDRDLAANQDNTKLGARPDDVPPYEGGWVWRTAEDAQAFIPLARLILNCEPAVYTLELPADWETDVSLTPHPEDGVHRLLNAAAILRRVDP